MSDSGMEDGMDGRGRGKSHADVPVYVKPKRTHKITLVLPPDGRIEKDQGFGWCFIELSKMIRCDRPSFPIICIGLWHIEADKQIANGNYELVVEILKPWQELATGKINLSDCKFRKLTTKERKELGL